jgi:hypothetical protein
MLVQRTCLKAPVGEMRRGLCVFGNTRYLDRMTRTWVITLFLAGAVIAALLVMGWRLEPPDWGTF